MAPSVLECGIAFPHARVTGLKQVELAVGRTVAPVAWATRGAPAVQLIFLMAVPATEATRYLHVLASLARLGQRPDLLQRLLDAPNAPAMHRILAEVDLWTE
jgi:mannitol/fructose-specific phosphotransferase system IIA component (Ntr-type)